MDQEKDKLSSDSIYLNQLEFKEEDGKSWMSFFINNFRLVIMIIVMLFAIGAYALFTLPLESNPEVKIPYGTVSVVLPGASPEDVEELIINKIEPELNNISGVKRVRSTATNSVGVMTVEFYADQDLDESIRRMRDSVDRVSGQLPDDAGDPTVMEVSFDNRPVWTIVITGPYDNFTLRKYAERVQDELETLPGASDVSVNGGDMEEISVTYDPQKLSSFGLTAEQVNSIIMANNVRFPLGSIDISDYRYTLRADSRFGSVEGLRNMAVFAQGSDLIRLKDVADVVEKAMDTDVRSEFSIEGGPLGNAITINVVKKTGYSIIELIDDGKDKITALLGNEIPGDVQIETTLDYAKEIRKDIYGLVDSGITTLLLVVAVLFIFVGFKEAVVAALAIPLVMAMTFGIMLLAGITINFLSLFSLILALGMLVDNAIVVLQATKQYIRTGKFTPEEAVLLVFRDFKYILITTTLTTVWAFLPLVLATGITGLFIRSIPVTVSATLVSSLIVAFVINHPLAVVFERITLTRKQWLLAYLAIIGLFFIALFGMFSPGYMVGKTVLLLVTSVLIVCMYIRYRKGVREILIQNEHNKILEKAFPEKIRERMKRKYALTGSKRGFINRFYTGLIHLDAVLPFYQRILYLFLRSKSLSIIAVAFTLVLFVSSMYLPFAGVLKSEFLPPTDVVYMYVNVEGPPGWVIEETQVVADQVAEVLQGVDSIKSFSLTVGSAGVQMGSFGGGSSTNTNRAQFSIILYDFAERPISIEKGRPLKSYEIGSIVREGIKDIKGAKVEVSEVSGGPPTGSDFAAQLVGEDLKELARLAEFYKSALVEIPGTINEDISLENSPGEFVVNLKYDNLALHGLTAGQVAQALRTAVSGLKITTYYRDAGDDLDIQAAYYDKRVISIDSIKNLTFSNGRGQIYRLGDLADIELTSSLASIAHLDQKRVVTVSSSVQSPRLPSEVLEEFQKFVDVNPLPKGYEVSYGGQNEENAESIYSIFRAMIIAMLLIIVTLIIQFNSFKKTFIVLLTIPLATTGVFFGLWAVGLNLSFPVLIGMLSLFGIVVNNAIVLVDKISANFKTGISFHDSIIDAAKSRLEAIFLTSIATIIGVFPLIFYDETWTGLSMTLVFGLSTSTILTLFIIPILYNLLLGKSAQEEAKIRELRLDKEQVGN